MIGNVSNNRCICLFRDISERVAIEVHCSVYSTLNELLWILLFNKNDFSFLVFISNVGCLEIIVLNLRARL